MGKLLLVFLLNCHPRCVSIDELVGFIGQHHDFTHSLVVFTFFEQVSDGFGGILKLFNQLRFQYGCG